LLEKGAPAHDTFGEVFRVLEAQVFESCFWQWIGSIVGMAKGVVAFDGKTVRGSKDGPNTALHMVSAPTPPSWAYRWGRKARPARGMNWPG
jgi:hypothetical protein